MTSFLIFQRAQRVKARKRVGLLAGAHPPTRAAGVLHRRLNGGVESALGRSVLVKLRRRGGAAMRLQVLAGGEDVFREAVGHRAVQVRAEYDA